MKYLLLFFKHYLSKKGGVRDRSLQNLSSLKITLRLLQQSLGSLDSYFRTFFCPVKQNKELERHFKHIPKGTFIEGCEIPFLAQIL